MNFYVIRLDADRTLAVKTQRRTRPHGYNIHKLVYKWHNIFVVLNTLQFFPRKKLMARPGYAHAEKPFVFFKNEETESGPRRAPNLQKKRNRKGCVKRASISQQRSDSSSTVRTHSCRSPTRVVYPLISAQVGCCQQDVTPMINNSG